MKGAGSMCAGARGPWREKSITIILKCIDGRERALYGSMVSGCFGMYCRLGASPVPNQEGKPMLSAAAILEHGSLQTARPTCALG